MACAPLAGLAPALSHESEQYTLPAGRDFADLGPYFSKIAYDAVVSATAETNAAIARAIESGQAPSQIEELQSADHIAGNVWAQLFAAIPANEIARCNVGFGGSAGAVSGSRHDVSAAGVDL